MRVVGALDVLLNMLSDHANQQDVRLKHIKLITSVIITGFSISILLSHRLW